MKMERYVKVGILLSLSLWIFANLLSVTSFAAPVDFPKKEITIIVNMGVGGGRDILARGIGNTMSKYLGVPVVVVNTPGAGGARGLTNLYHSAPDGYTIGIGCGTDIVDQVIEKREYDNKKFTYIGNAQHSPGFLFVKSDSHFRSVKDFKTFGKPVRHSTSSLNWPLTVASMVIAKREGFPLIVVAGYEGPQGSTLAAIRGDVEFASAVLSTAIPFVQARQIRIILTIDQKRCPYFPDIPTVGEAGHPDLERLAIDFWFMAPPGVPKPRVQILEEALFETLKDPGFLGWAKEAGVDIKPVSGEEMTQMVLNLFGLLEQYKGDIEKYRKK